jgi:hypothetical protein
MHRPIRLLALVVGLLLVSQVHTSACSLCAPGFQQTPTFREEAAQPFAKMILFGRVLDSQLRPDGTGSSNFAIDSVVRKDAVLGERKALSIPRYVPVEDRKEPPRFLMFCDVFQEKVDSYRGIPVKSDAIVKYLKQAMALDPKDGVARLRFYFDYLEHPEKEIASDAFLEFAKAQDRDIGEAAATFSAEKLRGWLKQPEIPVERLGVYAFLLGVCGTDADAMLLQTMLNDPSERMRSAYDGILSGLLHRKPIEGWKQVLQGLADGRTNLPLRLAMIRAVRVLYTWKPEANKENTLKAARAVLAQGELADLAIEDLRRWQLWDLTPDILALYGQKGYTAPIMERAIVRYALTNKGNPGATAFVAARRKEKPDLVAEVEEGLQFEK